MKFQALEEHLEEELLKTGKALRKDFREDHSFRGVEVKVFNYSQVEDIIARTSFDNCLNILYSINIIYIRDDT